MFALILIQILIFDASPAVGKICEFEKAVLNLNTSSWKTWDAANIYCSGSGAFLPTKRRLIKHCMNEWLRDNQLNPLQVWIGKLNETTSGECPLARMAQYSRRYSVQNTDCGISNRFACAFKKQPFDIEAELRWSVGSLLLCTERGYPTGIPKEVDPTLKTTGSPRITDHTHNVQTTSTKRNQPLTSKSATSLPSTATPGISVSSTTYISTATPENSIPTTSGILPTNPSKLSNPSANHSAGVIAGAVLGALFSIGCVCLAIFCFRRKFFAGHHSQEKDSTTKQNGIRKNELVDEYVYDEAAGGSTQARQNPLSDKINMSRNSAWNSSDDHKEAGIYNHLHEVDKTVNNSENVYNITQGNAESEYSHISNTTKTRDVADCEYSHIHGGLAGEEPDTYNHVHKGSAELDTDTYSHVHKGSVGLDKDTYSYA